MTPSLASRTRSRALAALAALVVLGSLARFAAAAPPPHRALPDYDGRPPAPASTLDGVRSAARAVLFPLRVAVDYVVRRPLGVVIRWAEHSRFVRARFKSRFRGTPSRTMSIFPIAFYDFGFQTSVGFRMLWSNGFATPGSKFSLKVTTAGQHWGRGDGSILVAVPGPFHGVRVGVDGTVNWRPDQQFFGLGPRSSQSGRARFLDARFGVSANLGWKTLALVLGTLSTYTGPSGYEPGFSMEEQVAAGNLPGPPAGYGDLAVTKRVGLRFALDSRDEDEHVNSGARLDGLVERVADDDVGRWTHLNATLGGALVLDRVGEHLLNVRVRLEMIDAPTGLQVPFLELSSIGGNRDLRGFGGGRGRDVSAAALALNYQWPLGAWLDATLYLATGNVFGRRLSGLTAGNLRGSAGVGVSLAGLSDERQVELAVAFGTDPFAEGGKISSYRLSLGYSYGY